MAWEPSPELVHKVNQMSEKLGVDVAIRASIERAKAELANPDWSSVLMSRAEAESMIRRLEMDQDTYFYDNAECISCGKLFHEDELYACECCQKPLCEPCQVSVGSGNDYCKECCEKEGLAHE